MVHTLFKHFVTWLGIGLFVAIPLQPVFAQAQRSYLYDSINTTLHIRSDATLEVTETQTFDFTGEYHMAFRYIPLSKLDRVTDMSVTDATTGKRLEYVTQKQDKQDSASWGKYTTYKNQGNQYIEWYFNANNEKRAWTIHYTILGNVEFAPDYERVYWNVFSGYDVPVRYSEARIIFPSSVLASSVKSFAYRSNKVPVTTETFPSQEIIFKSADFAPQEAFTVDLYVPQGTISKTAYYKHYLSANYGWIGGLFALIAALVAAFFIWLVREKLAVGRGTVVPQYEPPQHLKPAMAEVILTESLSNRGLTATIVDLAVRGYIKIEEEPRVNFWGALSISSKGWFKYGALVAKMSVLIFMLVLIIASFAKAGSGVLVVMLPFGVMVLILWAVSKQAFKLHDYKVTMLKALEGSEVEDYEKEYLNILMNGTDSFSTRDMKSTSPQKKQALYTKLQALKDKVFKETSLDTKAFYVGPYYGKKFAAVIVGILLVLGASVWVHSAGDIEVRQWELVLAGVGVAASALWAYVKYETRLNMQGRILKEEWLGFKMFLETAERYRLQNLTPDMFQKFLPYAMIFGIEKKWAKAFEGMNMEPPQWYGSGYAGMSASGHSSSFSAAGGFSPSVFSTSFSSSFSTAFATAGGGGSSGGGGGSAGGGGGGGGGGAG